MTMDGEIREILSDLHSLYVENVDIRDDPRLKAIQKVIKILKKAFPS